MKKILFIYAFMLLGIGSFAQQQDTTQYDQPSTPQMEQDNTMNEDSRNIEQGVESIPENDSENSMRDNTRESDAAQNEVEVLKDKEGPNNEVVYRFQGELFYVDRERGEIVNVEESELKENPHDVIVKDPMSTQQERAEDEDRRSGRQSPGRG